ncbi:MAG: N-acetyltransferase [Bacteroidota bacterium]
MDLILRKEAPSDYDEVLKLIKKAFLNEEYSDHSEHLLVDRLRKSKSFVPELSIVAELNKKIVGHILLTKIQINSTTQSFPSLALAPVSVHPDHQGKGIGGKLILCSHEVARDLGYQSIVLLGHENYYPRFGYERADTYGIELPFDVPPQNCMVIELIENGLNGVQGLVKYAKEFNINN